MSMNSLATLFLILMPMVIGYSLPKHIGMAKFGEQILTALVFLILIIIGTELALVEDLNQKVRILFLYLICLLVLTVGLGLMALWVFDKLSPCPDYVKPINITRPTINLRGNLLQGVCLLVGFGLGRLLPSTLLPPDWTTTVLLMGLLFLVGLLLKNTDISLQKALLNKRGLQISCVFTLSVLLGGLAFAFLFNEVSWLKGLALASGMGWYSLSGTLMTDSYGAIWGSVALLNDLGREILALLFIPYVMRYSSSAAIGLGGVTSLDFALPTLQKSGGTTIVPLAVSFGLITNILSPLLMVFFTSLGK